jgi:hypothetical protein
MDQHQHRWMSILRDFGGQRAVLGLSAIAGLVCLSSLAVAVIRTRSKCPKPAAISARHDSLTRVQLGARRRVSAIGKAWQHLQGQAAFDRCLPPAPCPELVEPGCPTTVPVTDQGRERAGLVPVSPSNLATKTRCSLGPEGISSGPAIRPRIPLGLAVYPANPPSWALLSSRFRSPPGELSSKGPSITTRKAV